MPESASIVKQLPAEKFPKFLKRNSYEQMLLSWVLAVRYNFNNVSVEKAVAQFYSYFSIDEKMFCKQKSACVIIYRAMKEYRMMIKQIPEKPKEKFNEQ
jgi:hypothetical protein